MVGEGIVPDMAPGSLKGLQLVVADLNAARDQLAERGVEVTEIQVMGESPTPQPDPLDNVGFFFFSDPDGNGWAVQQISARVAGTVPPQAALQAQERPRRDRITDLMSWPEKILLTTGIVFFVFAFALIAMMLGDIVGGPQVRAA